MVILLLTLSSGTPDSAPLISIPHFDKVGHFALFFILAVLLTQGWAPLDKWGKWLGIVCYCLLFASGTEYLQNWVPTRKADMWDFLADMAGSAIGFCTTRYINFRF